MEPDFSGWATKNDLRCTDGRTIKHGAFAHQDKQKVPLVWAHQHNDPANVLGHAILENRAFGTYAYGFFNDSPSGQQAKELVIHKDINSMSIFANNLQQRGGDVLHGDIKEVSLVMAGANPGAQIENVYIKHGDDYEEVDGEAVIHTGLYLEHEDYTGETMTQKTVEAEQEQTQELQHGDPTIQDIIDTMDEQQRGVLEFIVGELAGGNLGNVQHAEELDDIEYVDQEAVLAHIDNTIKEGFAEMTSQHRNVFDTTEDDKPRGATLSHDQLATILKDANKPGETLKTSFLSHAVEYGIENIDFLFPDAKTLSNQPDFLSRRTEWVAGVLDSARHSPFSRIKSVVADITAEEARAKGYVKGNLKKEEILKLLKRTTTPTTVYKKQKLDRDDIVDITDLDVVAWLKVEMRLMLDEELARAILIGDGREPDDDDKIDEDHLRPIAYDDDMYTSKVTLASTTSAVDTTEAIIRSRNQYKGTGTPTFYTTDGLLTDMLLQKDKMGRRLYDSVAALAAVLRVKDIVVVEVMETVPDILGILVNLVDYTIGADKGGEVSMFDDFDIDYNQFKYLIETRVSGALTKPKAAVVIKKSLGTVVTPVQPTYNPTTHVITFPSVTGVIYSVDGVDKTGTLTITETTDVESRPATGYSFPHNIDSDWVFVF